MACQRSTGEPCAVYRVVCDAAAAVPALVFPMASPRVTSGERTFWEKATAIHVFASGGKFRGQSRFSRHWYDVMQLGAAGFADRAVRDRPLAHAVAQHKAAFFVEKDDAGQVIDYEQAVGGNLRLVPLDGDLLRLRDDYQKMVNDGLLMDEAVPFEEVMRRCRAIEARANEAARR